MTTILVCGECARAGLGYFEPEFEPHEDGSSIHRCPNCGRAVVVALSMGELDLGFIRPAPDSSNDFRMFLSLFERPPV